MMHEPQSFKGNMAWSFYCPKLLECKLYWRWSQRCPGSKTPGAMMRWTWKQVDSIELFWFNLIHYRLFSGNVMDSVDCEARFLILKEGRQDGICSFLNFLDPVSFVFEWILSDELFFVHGSGPAFWVLPSGWNHPQSEMGFKVSPSQQGIRLIPHWVHCSCPWTHTVCDDMS